MYNIWKIFTTDIRRISNNVVAVVIIMGLSILPALYAWFNIFSNWDPYEPAATSQLKVAVASDDAGAEIMGLYQLILPVYSILLSLTSVGLTTGVSNLSAWYQALGDRRAILIFIKNSRIILSCTR